MSCHAQETEIPIRSMNSNHWKFDHEKKMCVSQNGLYCHSCTVLAWKGNQPKADRYHEMANR